MEDPAAFDDMGIAIFWRGDRFSAEGLEFRLFSSGGGGVVRVRLRDRRRDGVLVVMGSHLGSGDSPADEEWRLRTQVADPEGGLEAWARETCAAGDALVLALDANSHPQLMSLDGVSSCWRSLRAAVGASVWDGHFDAVGNATCNGEGLDPPVSSNKVRGPLSGQARKIGLHAYYLIDHIFFNPAALRMRGHVLAPRRFASDAAALEALEPSLANPSDHYPVVVDLAWGPHAAAEIRVSARRSVASYLRVVASLLRGTHEPIEELALAGLGGAIGVVAGVASRAERDGLAEIGRTSTTYIAVGGRRCAQLRVVLKSVLGRG